MLGPSSKAFSLFKDPFPIFCPLTTGFMQPRDKRLSVTAYNIRLEVDERKAQNGH